jgi:DNA-binding NarL/FixJ family response regulator
MVTEKIRQLEATKAKVAKLEQSVATELRKELAAMPASYGFDSVEAFIAAVSAAAGGRRGRAKGAGAGKAAHAGRKRRRRAVITEETRAEVKKLAGAGKTGAEIAAAIGISLPSVQNIKKALGLVKARK